MVFKLSEKQELIRKTAREIADKEIAPIASEIDEKREIPQKVFATMAKAGFFGIHIPPPFGGAGGDMLDVMIAVEEISAASASVGWSLTASVGTALLILAFGTDEQRKKYLPAMAKGEMLGAFGLVEPAAGTNWQLAMQTSAKADGDHYVINGSKYFVSNAGEGEIFIVMTRTDPSKGPMGFTTFIIEKDMKDFSIGTIEDKFGLRGDHNGELLFDNCRVPKENLLGQEGGGMKVFQANAAFDCIGQAAVCVGMAQAALNAAVKHVKQRTIVKPLTLAHLDQVQAHVADMTAATETARLLTYRGALALAERKPDPLIFMAPIYANEVAMDVTGRAVQLHGGVGCTKDYPVGVYFRDAKTLSLQKSLDYVRLMAGKSILGIPPGPPPKPGAH